MRLGSRAWLYGAMMLLLTLRLAVGVAVGGYRFDVNLPWMLAGDVALAVTACVVGALGGVRDGLIVGACGVLMFTPPIIISPLGFGLG